MSKWKLKESIINFFPDSQMVFNKTLLLNVNYLNKRFLVYNGHRYVSLLIKDFMLGYRIGEFVTTKRLGKKIHLKKK